MSTPGGFGSVHILEGSSNAQVNNSHFHTHIHGHTAAHGSYFEHIYIIDDAVAPNAILNAGGRVDLVRCYPGTREEVISKAENWMAWGYREDCRIFWLSGPAGAGKSAIVQTLAENAVQGKALMANFFFFRADPSRAHSRPIVATLLYQLFDLVPGLDAMVNNIIRRDRLILKKSIRDQLMKLLDGPMRSLRHGQPEQPPIVLLIDGLDECDSRHDLDTATKSEQRLLLNALHELVTLPDSSFIVLVASRVESHIEMVFNRIGCSRFSIFLNSNYRPLNNIRVYLTRELSIIKRTHPLGRYLEASWPSDPAINAIVAKSSGQFIYAATIIRFISNSSDSPALTIEMILHIRPALNHSPFADIDAIYAFILSRCQYWEHTRKFLALDSILRAKRRAGFHLMDGIHYHQLSYTEQEVRSFFGDLKSIIRVEINNGELILLYYHASFDDFAYSSSRAGKFFIDVASICNLLAPQMLLRQRRNYGIAQQTLLVLEGAPKRSKLLTNAILHLLTKSKSVPFGKQAWKARFTELIKELYAGQDDLVFKQMLHGLRKWDRPRPLKRRNPKRVYLRRSDRPELKQKVTTFMEICTPMRGEWSKAELCRKFAPFRLRKKKSKIVRPNIKQKLQVAARA